MINPPIESLLGTVDSKFTLVTLAARRARNINSYFNQLGDGLGHMIPPQVSSVARKPLSIAFEEISEHKIVWTRSARGSRRRRRVRRRGRGAGDGRRRRVHRRLTITPPSLAPQSLGRGTDARRQADRSGGDRRDRRVQGDRGLSPTRRCRRPCGADHDRGRRALHRADHTERARLGARADRAVGQPDHTDSAHPHRSGRRPDPGRAGDGATSGGLPIGSVDRPADEHADRHSGPGRGVPGDAHRDVGAPQRRRERGGRCETRGVHIVEPESGRLAGGDVGAGRLADPASIVAEVERVLGPARSRRRLGGGVGRRHTRADRCGPGDRQPQLRQAGLRRRRRGRRVGAHASRWCRRCRCRSRRRRRSWRSRPPSRWSGRWWRRPPITT